MGSTCAVAGWSMSAGSLAEQHTGLECAFARHGRSLYRYFAVRAGGDAHQADDLMQQLWMRAKRGAAAVPVSELERWLRAVARNLIREHWRKQAATPWHVRAAEPLLAADLADRIADQDLPEEYMQRKEVQDQLVLAVTELATAEQEVIVAHYFQDESLASLADRLGVSRRTVERRLYGARRALRRKLKNLDS